MRVNIYAEEMTERVEIISKVIEGQSFTGLRLYLELPVTVGRDTEGRPINTSGPFMHHPGDDDSAAVTFWGKRDLRAVLRIMLAKLDEHYGEHTSATGGVCNEIYHERRRQITSLGFDHAHDATHTTGQLAQAAAALAYCSTLTAEDSMAHAALVGARAPHGMSSVVRFLWPWSRTWFKLRSPRRDLVKAGALIVAEIERLDRKAAREAQP